ncbi:MAG: cell division protein FtsX [Lysobacteraceae bacterium]|nr:MAG: cell division protein FtsX [Xanthomonadaceae bacterium]
MSTAGRGRMRAWLRAHRLAFLDAWARLRERPLTALTTIAVLALALLLPLLLGGMVREAHRFSAGLAPSGTLSLFLDPRLGEAEARGLAARLEQDVRVASLSLHSPGQALAALREDASLAPALEVLEDNPLPWRIEIQPAVGADAAALAEALATLPEVDQLVDDARWRERLAAWLALARRLAWLLAGLLAAALVLAIGNSIRLEVRDRAEEILTLRLLGASDAWIRRPFLYVGGLLGGCAGMLAALLCQLARQLLEPPLVRLLDSYGSGFMLVLWAPAELVGVVLLAAALGVGGAGLAVAHHLGKREGSA